MGRLMFRIAIYGLAAFEIGMLLFYMAQYEAGVTSGSGAQDMGMFFNVLMLAPLLAAAILFHFAKGQVLRGAAAIVVMAPVIIVAYAALRWAVSPIIMAVLLGMTWWWISSVRRKSREREPAPGCGRLDDPQTRKRWPPA